MDFETMLNSIKGSFKIEDMDMPNEIESNIRMMESGEKDIERCIKETISKYSVAV